MIALWVRMFSVLSLMSLALAKTADCIISEVGEAAETLSCLHSAVDGFHHCKGTCNHCRDIKPLLNIYRLNVELDDQLEELIDDVQTSCNFNSTDSERILLTLTQILTPVTETLDSFRSKHCDFENSLGPVLTHRVVGGSLRRTRCLTLDLLRSFECRLDTTYKEILSASQAELDSGFQKVLCLY